MVLSRDQSLTRLRTWSHPCLVGGALALALAFACQSPGQSTPAKPPEPFKPSIGLRPVAISLSPNATQTFQAEINYQEGVRFFRQPVTWRVVEPGGGTITGTGLYTAPGLAGTYHVQVQREDFPEITAVATVTVK
jgi:hypothetical protein